MYDYDRRATFNLQVQAGQAAPLGQLTKVFVDGKQLGLISSLEMKVTASNRDQYVRIGVLEGFPDHAWAKTPEDTRRTAREVVAQLRRFPYVEVVCPEFLR